VSRQIYQVGDRFGRWTLLEVLPPKGTTRQWRVRCECGEIKVVFAGNLTGGRSHGCNSCAAKERERRKREG
jgi:hypothetical protein